MKALNKPLTNLQIEMLQLFGQGVSDDDLMAIKRLIAKYFADRAADEMDTLWEHNNWSNETMDEWLSDSNSTKESASKK